MQVCHKMYYVLVAGRTRIILNHCKGNVYTIYYMGNHWTTSEAAVKNCIINDAFLINVLLYMVAYPHPTQ